MAGTYTNSASGAGMRYGMHAYIKVVVTDTSNTVCRVRVECWAVSDGGYSGFIDGRCSAYAGGSYGSWTGHDQDVTAGGSTRLNYAEFNVDRGTSDKYVTYWAQIKGTSTSSSNYYYGCSESVSVEAKIPKIPVEKPNAPTGCSATYVSDTSVSVAWTNGGTTGTKPRTATLVERSTDGGAFAQIASVGGTASSYADNGTTANHSYAYRVRASNAAGYSSYATTGTIYTTPAAPSAVTLDKTAATTVQVGIEGAPPYATGYNVERTQDGTTWANVGTGVSLPLQDTVSGGTVKYRVAAVNGSLVSPWAVSEAIVTICPPLAPTITQQPANPTVAGTAAVISWTPNHPDGTSQTAAQVKFDGTAHDVGADVFSYSQTVQVGTHTVQVRTKGLDADWGAWSSVISFNAYNPPSIVIDSPSVDGETVTALPLYIEWGVTDSTGVSTQRVTVTDSNGTQIYNRTQGASVRSLALTDSDIALRNGGSYTISLRVMGGSGLVTEALRTFDVEWASPAAPRLDVSEGEGASAQIIATAGEEGAATNLAPFFSMPLTGSHWASVSDGIARIGDGWAHFEVSDGAVFNAATIPDELQPSTQYTVLVEFRNVSGAATVSLGDWAVQIQGTDVAVRDGLFSTSGSNATINATYGTSGTDIQFAEKDVFASAVSAETDGGDAYLLGTTRDNLADASVFVGGTVSGQVSMDMRLSIYEGEYDGSYAPYNAPTTQAITVQRVNADGTVWTVATDLQSGTTCIDPLPPLGVEAVYIATASAASGATASGRYTATIGGREWALNFGNAAQEHMELRYNPEASYSLAQGGTSYHFADGGAGGGRPVYYATTDRDENGALKFATIGKDDADRLRALCDRYPVAWIRDPFGHRWRAHVKPSWSHGVGQLWPVGIDWDAVRWTEAWDG